MGFWGNLLKGVGVAAAPFSGGASLALTGLGAAGDILGGMAKGSADERANLNAFLQNQDRNKAALYNTKQGAVLDALLAGGRDKLTGYQTRQGAITDAMQGRQQAYTNALANASAEKIALAKLGLEAPTAHAKASVLGSMMKNLQPYAFESPIRQQGHLTKMTGGLSAATLDPITRAHGEALMKSALEKQLSGGGLPGATDFLGGIQDWDKAVLDIPEATDYSKGIIEPPSLSDYKKAGKGESWLSGLSGALGLAGAVGGAFGKTSTPPVLYSDADWQGPMLPEVRPRRDIEVEDQDV